MVSRVKLRVALRLVMVVNIFAAMLVAAISSVAASTLVVLAILAIALDVALLRPVKLWPCAGLRCAARREGMRMPRAAASA